MKTMLRTMKNQKSGIPKDVLAVFESIVQTYSENECDYRFMEAMGEHLAEKQRFTLWEKHGGCQGTGQDKVRKAFALEHIDKPLSVRLELYVNTFIRDYTGKTQRITLNEEKNTITVIFACDECYRHTLKIKPTASFMLYNERCAGGRMYTLEKALGIKLKIHSIDIPQLGVSKESPCTYIFKIVG